MIDYVFAIKLWIQMKLVMKQSELLDIYYKHK